MRLFVALDIPQEVRTRMSAFAERIRPLCPGARWARVEGLHITLKFIGEVPDAKALRDHAVAGWNQSFAIRCEV